MVWFAALQDLSPMSAQSPAVGEDSSEWATAVWENVSSAGTQAACASLEAMLPQDPWEDQEDRVARLGCVRAPHSASADKLKAAAVDWPKQVPSSLMASFFSRRRTGSHKHGQRSRGLSKTSDEDDSPKTWEATFTMVSPLSALPVNSSAFRSLVRSSFCFPAFFGVVAHRRISEQARADGARREHALVVAAASWRARCIEELASIARNPSEIVESSYPNRAELTSGDGSSGVRRAATRLLNWLAGAEGESVALAAATTILISPQALVRFGAVRLGDALASRAINAFEEFRSTASESSGCATPIVPAGEESSKQCHRGLESSRPFSDVSMGTQTEEAFCSSQTDLTAGFSMEHPSESHERQTPIGSLVNLRDVVALSPLQLSKLGEWLHLVSAGIVTKRGVVPRRTGGEIDTQPFGFPLNTAFDKTFFPEEHLRTAAPDIAEALLLYALSWERQWAEAEWESDMFDATDPAATPVRPVGSGVTLLSSGGAMCGGRRFLGPRSGSYGTPGTNGTRLGTKLTSPLSLVMEEASVSFLEVLRWWSPSLHTAARPARVLHLLREPVVTTPLASCAALADRVRLGMSELVVEHARAALGDLHASLCSQYCSVVRGAHMRSTSSSDSGPHIDSGEPSTAIVSPVVSAVSAPQPGHRRGPSFGTAVEDITLPHAAAVPTSRSVGSVLLLNSSAEMTRGGLHNERSRIGHMVRAALSSEVDSVVLHSQASDDFIDLFASEDVIRKSKSGPLSFEGVSPTGTDGESSPVRIHSLGPLRSRFRGHSSSDLPASLLKPWGSAAVGPTAPSPAHWSNPLHAHMDLSSLGGLAVTCERAAWPLARRVISMREIRPLVEALVDRHPDLHPLRTHAIARTRYVTAVVSSLVCSLHGHTRSDVSEGEILESNVSEAFYLCATESLDKVTPFAPAHVASLSAAFDRLDRRRCGTFGLAEARETWERWLAKGPPRASRPAPFVVPLECVERALKGFARPLASGERDRFCFEDFVFFELAQRDAMANTSIEYWHRILDIDGDSKLGRLDIECSYDNRIWGMRDLAPDPSEAIAPDASHALLQLVDLLRSTLVRNRSRSGHPPERSAHSLSDTAGSRGQELCGMKGVSLTAYAIRKAAAGPRVFDILLRTVGACTLESAPAHAAD
jgi:hypothetical protein